jgi:hypothetical protein
MPVPASLAFDSLIDAEARRSFTCAAALPDAAITASCTPDKSAFGRF